MPLAHTLPNHDTLALYDGAPVPDHIPTVESLARAYAHFRAHYSASDPEHRLILDSAGRAFAALQERPWTVLADGTLELTGSDNTLIYQAGDGACRQKGRTHVNKQTGQREPALCPSYLFQQRRHGGACYHLIAREILRLAQIFEGGQPPTYSSAIATATPYLPFVTLAGRLLGLAFGIARLPEQPVTLHLDQSCLTILAGDPPLHRIELTCSDGAGQVSIRLTALAFGTLWQALRPCATSLPRVTLFVDCTDSLVLLSGDDFAVKAQGTLL
jgi:hypothetical protein